MVIQFPNTRRIERERTLDVAAKVIPLLQAALDSDNAMLLRDLFAVLGDVAQGRTRAAGSMRSPFGMRTSLACARRLRNALRTPSA